MADDRTAAGRNRAVAALHAAIDRYLVDERTTDGTGWATVEDGDMDGLYDLIHQIIRLKWRPDCDGDLPVECRLVDRTKFESLCYDRVPYDHKDDVPITKQLEVRLANLRRASDGVERFLHMLRHGGFQIVTTEETP